MPIDQQQSKLPPPTGRTTRAYRSPRKVKYDEVQEGEERGSDTPSEREEPHNRTKLPRHKDGMLNRTPSRHGKRATRYHHRDHLLELGHGNGEHTDDPWWPTTSNNNRVTTAIGYGRDPPPRTGGDVYLAPNGRRHFVPRPDREYPNPFTPRAQRPPQPTYTEYGQIQESYYTDHPIPPEYPTSPPFESSPLYPTPPYPLYPGAYPPDPLSVEYYPPQSSSTNMYPIDHGLDNRYPVDPLYDEIPHRVAHVADTEVDKLKRQIRKLEMRDRQREDEKRAEEQDIRRRKRDEDERTKRREKRRKEQERMRRAESQSRRETEAKTRSKRSPVDQEFDDGVYEKKKEKEVRAAMEYMAAGRAGREISGRRQSLQDNGIDDEEHILLAIKEFIEQRLQHQERLGLEEKSVGTNFESRRGNRLEVVPFEPRVDVTRAQIEDIVVDVLQRVGVRQIQNMTSAWDKSTALSGERRQDNKSTRSHKSSSYESHHNGELEVRLKPHHGGDESEQLNPRTPGSQVQFSDHTVVDTRYQPLDIDRDSVRLRKPPGARNDLERQAEKNAPPLRVKTPAALNNDSQATYDDQSAEDEYQPTKKHHNRGHIAQKNAAGKEITRRRPEKESKQRRQREVVGSDTDDSADMFIRRPSKYSGKPLRESRRHRSTLR